MADSTRQPDRRGRSAAMRSSLARMRLALALLALLLAQAAASKGSWKELPGQTLQGPRPTQALSRGINTSALRAGELERGERRRSPFFFNSHFAQAPSRSSPATGISTELRAVPASSRRTASPSHLMGRPFTLERDTRAESEQ